MRRAGVVDEAVNSRRGKPVEALQAAAVEADAVGMRLLRRRLLDCLITRKRMA